MKIKYIYGLEHSGSTAFSIKLAQESKGLAVGEIYNFFRGIKTTGEGDPNKCSCGKNINQCELWKKFYNKNLNIYNKYKKLLKYAKENNIDTIIDSSKNIKGLKIWKKIIKNEKNLKLEIYMTIRNPLGYALSLIKQKKRSKQKPKSIIWYIFLWYRKQAMREFMLKRTIKEYKIINGEKIILKNKNIKTHIVNSNRNKYALNII